MKCSLISLATLALVGCTSLDHAGHTSYSLRSFSAPNGAVACCELHVQDGKEYSGRNISFQTDGSGAMLQVQEGESKAFKGQGIAAKAATVLPVNLGDALK